MYCEHGSFTPPTNPNQVIWRYLDFTKYVDLLSTSTLYFTRPDYFTDIFEGSIPKKTVEWRDYQEWQKILSIPDYKPVNWSQHYYSQREQVAINCWHMNDFESEAMWKLYLQSNEGVAIQSTFNDFIKCFDNTDINIYTGAVKYIDYTAEHFDIDNNFNAFLHKRKSFEHEKELRAVIWSTAHQQQRLLDISSGGIKVPINLNTLIKKVYLSPDSKSWFLDLVNTATKKYGYDFQVMKSNLIDKPTF